MIPLLFSIVLAAPAQPLAVRADIEALGRGTSATVVAVAFQIAPEDRERAGSRVRVSLSFVRGTTVADRITTVVEVAADGSGILYREWPAGEGEARVTVEALDGAARGAWRGPFVVPVLETPFQAPDAAPADAVALVPPSEEGAIRFLPPPRTGGIGALQLEVEAPPETARIEFFQDDLALIQRNKPPWTVSVTLGEIARRTTVRAAAYRADGTLLGEDAVVLNASGGTLAVEILVAPKSPEGGKRAVTVAVGAGALEEVVLRGDDRVLARWPECPCVVRVSESDLAGIRVLSAEARSRRGVRGEAVRLLGATGYVSEIRVEQVELPVVVLDQRGAPVSTLTRDDFTVLEDGQEVAVDTFATTADLPLSLGVVVDVSGSMIEAFPQVRQAVGGFIGSLIRPGDSLFLLAFSWEPKVVVEWTRDARALDDAMARLTPEGGTSLHDAAVKALEQFRGRRGRTAVVLLTDGDDTTSRTGWDVALRFAKTARTPLFPIGFQIGKLDFFVRERLRDLAEATGGQTFFPNDGASLQNVYTTIGDQLRAQYLISYRSPSSKPNSEYRSVTVRVRGEGLTARTIAGYFPGS
ncbi:MAG: VWA domain-containing protein [Acidobacteriota bacterium]